MTVDIEEMRAWVDGELDEPRAGQVGYAVQFDKILQRDADKLRASQLSYREAYDNVPAQEVPASLRLKIQTLQETVGQGPDVQDSPSDMANHRSFKMVGIAASVLLAALVGYLAGTNTTDHNTDTTAALEVTPDTDNFAQTNSCVRSVYLLMASCCYSLFILVPKADHWHFAIWLQLKTTREASKVLEQDPLLCKIIMD